MRLCFGVVDVEAGKAANTIRAIGAVAKFALTVRRTETTTHRLICVITVANNATDQQARTNEPRSGWTMLRALLHPFVMRIVGGA